MKSRFILFVFISLMISAPIIGACEDPLNPREERVQTEAGKIDFSFLHNIKNPQVFHRIARAHSELSAVELEDGSLWTVGKMDAVKGWENSHRLVLTQNQATFSTHRYALVNPDLRLAVPVSLSREPTPKEKAIFFIKGIDRVNDILQLNDNRRWIVHSSDRSIFTKMAENDRAIIGVNTKEIDKKCPYLIINTTDRGSLFVRASYVN